jgi:hypothetical protein
MHNHPHRKTGLSAQLATPSAQDTHAHAYHLPTTQVWPPSASWPASSGLHSNQDAAHTQPAALLSPHTDLPYSHSFMETPGNALPCCSQQAPLSQLPAASRPPLTRHSSMHGCCHRLLQRQADSAVTQ